MKIEYLVEVKVSDESFNPVDILNIQDGIESALQRDKNVGVVEDYSVTSTFAQELK